MADTVGVEPEELRPGAVSGTGVGTFASLAIPDFRQLWGGNVLSFLAIQMQMIARGWLALDLTGSNAGLGGVFLAFGVPMLVVTPFGGVAADRLSKRRLLLGAQIAMTASAGLVGAAVVADVLAYWMLIAAGALQGLSFSVLGPTRMAFTAELVGRRLLANAVVLQQMAMNGSRVLGPSLAGVLIGVPAVGAGGVYLLSTALLAAAIVSTAVLPPGRPETRSTSSPLTELADGVRYVRSRPELTLLVVTAFVVVIAAFPYIAFLPTVADEIFDVGSVGFGLLSGATAVGAVAVSLAIASRADGQRALRLQRLAGVGFGAGVLALALSPSFAVALVAAVLLGAAASAFQSLNNSLVLARTEPAYHGRVQSLNMLSFSGFGMAALPLGALADAIGLRETLVAMAAVTLLAMLVSTLLARRRLLPLAEG